VPLTDRPRAAFTYRLEQQNYSGSLQSEGDRYSYAASDDSGGHSGDDADSHNEPLMDNPYYKKLQDLNR
jgi:hypothetical protein